MPPNEPTLPVGEWLPDRGSFDNPGVTVATNVLPFAPDSYVPVSQFVRSATSPLNAVPVGAFATQDTSGNSGIYTGTPKDLSVLTSANSPNFASASQTPGNTAAIVNALLSVSASGGSLATGTYFVKLTYVNPNGESIASAEGSIAVTGPTGKLTIASPAAAVNSTQYRVYVSTSSGTETLQTTTTIGTPTNITSLVAGAAIPTGTGPFLGTAWSFDIFDQSTVFASNGVDPLVSASPPALNTAQFTQVDSNAPKAKCIAVIQPGFLLAFNIVDVTLGTLPSGVRWSALGSAGNGSWPLVGSQAAISAQSDGQNIRGNNGPGRAIAANLASANAVLFFDKAVYRMLYTGDNKIFAIQVVEKLRGTVSGASVVTWGGKCYYVGHEGFMAFDGAEATEIGFGKVNRTFFKDADPNYLSQISGAVDPNTGLIFWAYAGAGNSNGFPNRIIVYNPVLNRFTWVVPATGVSNLMVGLTIGIALDNITSQLGYSLDAIPFSLDSAQLAGGNLAMAGFDSSNYFGFFTGLNDQFSVETTERQITVGRKQRIRGVRPMVEGDSVTAAVSARSSLSSPQVYGTATAMDRDGMCPQRVEGRYQRVQINGAAGNAVQFIKGARMIGTDAGSR